MFCISRTRQFNHYEGDYRKSIQNGFNPVKCQLQILFHYKICPRQKFCIFFYIVLKLAQLTLSQVNDTALGREQFLYNVRPYNVSL